MGIGNIANTGMRSAMSDMEIISNNISNANTVGFKSSRALFGDVYPASSAALQVGLGVRLNNIQQNFKAGGVQLTDSPLDLSISTSGFFILKDEVAGQVSYTRAGRFNRDADGRIGIGNRLLQGYPAVNGSISDGGNLVDLTISNNPRGATATSQINSNVNLDANATIPAGTFDPADADTYNYKTDKEIYDSLGNTYTESTYYVKTADNTWSARVYVDGTSVGTGTVSFDTNGNLSGTTGLDSLSFSPSSGATTPQTFAISLANSTQFAGSNESRRATQDGYPVGKLNGFEIDNDGNVIATYSNQERVLTGKIALANFQSPEGLSNVGNMSWIETSQSGNAIVNPLNSEGNIMQGALEGSNVDLTEQMVNLIGAQHNFQANAQVEQTFNEVMKTIINI